MKKPTLAHANKECQEGGRLTKNFVQYSNSTFYIQTVLIIFAQRFWRRHHNQLKNLLLMKLLYFYNQFLFGIQITQEPKGKL